MSDQQPLIGGAQPFVDDAPVPVPVKSENREKLTDDQITAEMEVVFDRAEAREAATPLEHRPMPPLPECRRSIEDTMLASYEWSEKPAELKAAERGTYEQIEERKKDAEKYGLSLDQREQILQTEDARQRAELSPALETVKRLYPDQKESAVVGWYAQVDDYIRRDPVGGKVGIDPAQLAQAAVYGHQQRQPTQAEYDAGRLGIPQEQYDRLTSGVMEFFEKEMPEAKRWENEILDTINRGRISRTANPIADLRAAAIHTMKTRTKKSKRGRAA